jgi:hypothetical protein
MKDFENKYILKNSQAPYVLELLKARCPLDLEYPEAQIASMYFDTYDLKLLKEKINSDLIKTKYRVRWYKDYQNGKTSGPCFLEVKSKLGEVRSKIRLKSLMSASDFENLAFTDQKFDEINDEFQRMKPMFKPLRPHFIVSYKRVRFKYPGSEIRFCIDYDIHVPKINDQWGYVFNESLKVPEAVFEIKGPEEDLPEMMKIIESVGAYRDSFSKYLACFQLLKNIKEF